MADNRSIYLINPKFQLKFSAQICLLIFLFSIPYPLTIYNVIEYIVTKINDPVITENLLRVRSSIIMMLAVWQIFFMAMVFIILIYQTHKVAGPIFKLRQFFNRWKQKENPGELYFRKGDYFFELANDFNEIVKSVQSSQLDESKNIAEIKKQLEELVPHLPADKKNVMHEAQAKLSEVQGRLDWSI